MELLEEADLMRDKGNFAQAVDLYKKAMASPIASMDDYETIKVVETSLYHLAQLYSEHKKVTEISQLLLSIQSIFSTIPKAKTAKIIRKLFDFAGVAGMSLAEQKNVC